MGTNSKMQLTAPMVHPTMAEERRKQRKAPVHRLEQAIEQPANSGIAGELKEIGCGTQPKQRFVREDVCRRGRCLARYKKLDGDKEGETSRQHFQQVNGTGNSRLETR
jgi:hypothetical protein